MQYFPHHSQVINLPVIGEMHWHLSIKWHLIYALFMPHLCAQVLQLFIKRPLLCQNMEIECRYSRYSQQTHQWTGSHWGALLTVTRKSHLGDCMAAGDAFLANWYPQEEHCSIWCNPVQHSWLQKTQFLHCDHVIVLYFRFKHVFFSLCFRRSLNAPPDSFSTNTSTP